MPIFAGNACKLLGRKLVILRQVDCSKITSLSLVSQLFRRQLLTYPFNICDEKHGNVLLFPTNHWVFVHKNKVHSAASDQDLRTWGLAAALRQNFTVFGREEVIDILLQSTKHASYNLSLQYINPPPV